MKILFINLSAPRFTVATPDAAPLGGSESAVCYLARALAARGHGVTLAANLPQDTAGTVMGVAHVAPDALRAPGFFAARAFDVIVLCNAPAAAAPVKAAAPDARILFWAHALPDQPSMQALHQPETKRAIDAAIFVSRWQQNEIETAFGPSHQPYVIGNGIAPVFENMFADADALRRAKQNRAAYTATPFRGLSVLVRAMDGFDGDTNLDVFSSMGVYQGDDSDYAGLFARAAQNPAIACHGAVAQSALASALRHDAFLFYPCIYRETFCTSVAEAMAAGMQIVATDLGALRETTMGFADLVDMTMRDGGVDGDALTQHFRAAMRRAVDAFINDRGWAERLFEQSQRASRDYGWAARATAWEAALRNLV
ncbi:MAG: glycosyltransferase family 4 protein [Alphaproteobacteria bacterium]|nr:glycosyltransferase family 4 protein [Alphaproteobacteria bacterium]